MVEGASGLGAQDLLPGGVGCCSTQKVERQSGGFAVALEHAPTVRIEGLEVAGAHSEGEGAGQMVVRGQKWTTSSSVAFDARLALRERTFL